MQNYDQIQSGWEAVDRDGSKIGTIQEVAGNYFVITKGLIFTQDVFVPFSAVESVDQDGFVRLNIQKDEIDSLGWDEPPTESMSESTAGSRSYGSMSSDTVASGDTLSGDTLSGDRLSGDRLSGDNDTLRVPVREEQLRAEKVRSQEGEVQVNKNVVEEQREMDIPVTRDEVHVRRVATDRAATGDESAFSDGDTIRVPVTAEKLNVDKETRVVEEIEISKRPVTETQRVSDTVRREEVNVDEQGNVHGTSDSRRGTSDDWSDRPQGRS